MYTQSTALLVARSLPRLTHIARSPLPGAPLMAVGRASTGVLAAAAFRGRRFVAASTVTSTPSASMSYPADVTTHAPNRMHGSYHWTFERALALSLIPLTTLQCVHGAHPITDLLVGVVLPLHCHVGWDAIITDYIPARKRPRLYKAAIWALRTGTAITLFACYQFNTNDVGLTELVRRVWLV